MLETIQYVARPASKLNVKKPNISGIIHSIIRLVDCCCGVADAVGVIFCITNIDPPTSSGSRTGTASSLAYLARSIHKKELSSGTT